MRHEKNQSNSSESPGLKQTKIEPGMSHRHEQEPSSLLSVHSFVADGADRHGVDSAEISVAAYLRWLRGR
jgi:hypothetical protein